MTTPTLKNFVNGNYVEASGKDAMDLIDPATEAVYAQAPISSAADVDAAYAAAADAFETWGNTTPGERQLALFRIADEMENLADQLKPDVIRAARADEEGRKNLDRLEYALGTIGKALILTDYSVDEQKDLDKLEAFRELHGKQ